MYGDMLVYYAEQFVDLIHFRQVARVGSGYTIVGEPDKFRGIIQTGHGRSFVGVSGRLSNHANWKTLAVSEERALWSYSEWDVGSYIKEPNGSDIFVVGKRLDWSREAGFFACVLQRLIGDDGTMPDSLPLKEGTY